MCILIYKYKYNSVVPSLNAGCYIHIYIHIHRSIKVIIQLGCPIFNRRVLYTYIYIYIYTYT